MVMVTVMVTPTLNPLPNHNPDPNPNPVVEIKNFFGELFASSRRTPLEFARTRANFAWVRQVFAKYVL